MTPRSGRAESVPYSLSRWTDVPAAKWSWFEQSLADGKMQAIDPRLGVPDWWSLEPQETHSLIFWTKDPRPIVRDFRLLRPFHVEVNVTITGWHEVEHGAPDSIEVCESFTALAKKLGKANVSWRFSPVPLLPNAELFQRFTRLTKLLGGVTDRVYVSFLQPNDRLPETRGEEERLRVLTALAEIANRSFIDVLLCNDDKTLACIGVAPNLSHGVCVPPRLGKSATLPAAERCGCAVMVDPFSINETCTFGCLYCYAADKSLASKKRNTTKGLPVLR